jgi:hypothetical protein
VVVPQRSQLGWLEHDRVEVRRLLTVDATLFDPLADLTDLRRHTLHFVIADLFWQIWHHAIAVEVLLREELGTSTVVVQRALYEAISTMNYLHVHPNRAVEAEVLLASTYLRDIAVFADQNEVREEREAILSRMPADSVNTARRRLATRPNTWSGKNIRQMMADANITGYETLYRHLSSKAHAGVVGEHVRIEGTEGSTGTIHLGPTVSAKNVEAHANFARRGLHGSLLILWDYFGRGRPLHMQSSDPFAWALAPAT